MTTDEARNVFMNVFPWFWLATCPALIVISDRTQKYSGQILSAIFILFGMAGMWLVSFLLGVQ